MNNEKCVWFVPEHGAESEVCSLENPETGNVLIVLEASAYVANRTLAVDLLEWSNDEDSLGNEHRARLFRIYKKRAEWASGI